jgi:hypothetical protein
MKKSIFTSKFAVGLFAFALLLACSSSAFAAATIIINNLDGPNEGFNDTTAAAPVGGNPGTTLGAQRLFAFTYAANIWGATLDSNQPIIIQAAFNPLATNVLGSAGATFIFSDFGATGFYPGPEFANTWYGSALADKRSGIEQNPGVADINAQFSSNFNFYLGVDGNHGALNDLVAVLLHEFAHGLNFQQFGNVSTGANPANQTDIYQRHILDLTTGLYFDQMTNAQRQAAALRYGKIVWDGAKVSADVPNVLSFGSPEVRVLTPTVISGPYQFGTAAFGPAISSPGVTGNLVPAQDAADVAGPATTDGCSPFTNAAAIAGNIALVERGTCGFVVKARNATNAGAVGVIIYNNAANAAAAPPGMAGNGTDDPFVTIPAVSLNRDDGLAIVAQPGATGKMSVDLSIRAGASPAGMARLYAVKPVAPGSSISHFDTIASRNLLMEPAISPDLTHSVKPPEDLTLNLLRDVGWFADADLDGEPDSTDCEPNSDLRPTVVIAGCDSGVPNIMFTAAPNRGCTLADRIAHIAAASAANHGTFVKNANVLLNELKKNGTITAAQKDVLSSCVGASNNP